jgi:uncharacterized protein DUF4058
MPMHDWTKVEAGIFHAFHHRWISALSDSLNGGKLPPDYYALPEQIAVGVEPDVLTLQDRPSGDIADKAPSSSTAMLIQSRPHTRFTAETDAEFYRRKKSTIVVRHISGDRVVAMIEIVSPGNKSTRHAFRAFIDEACELLERRIHLLIVDPFPPGRRDPNGIHPTIWEQVQDAPFELPAGQPLTLAAYECDHSTRAYIETFAVGQPLPDMPLFLQPEGCIMVPLESTYLTAFAVMPRRWQSVLEPSART